jgi:serine/threonine-protein kinase
MLGRVIGSYRVERLLGEGGFGTVWLGRHTSVERLAAVKTVHPRVARDPKVREGLIAEQRLLDRVKHAHSVAIYDVVVEGDEVFLVMEYADGRTLWSACAEGPLPVAQVGAMGQQLLSALALAHVRGVVHRDIKPQNIMLTSTGARLLDFGIGDLLREADSGSGTAVTGSPAWLAPEVWTGQRSSPAADIYALGLCLWYALAGRPAHEATTVEAWRRAHASLDVPDVRTVRPDTPAWLAEVITRACRRDLSQRLPDGKAMLRVFRANMSLSVELRLVSDHLPDDYAATLTPVKPIPARPARSSARFTPWVAVLVAGLVAAGVVVVIAAGLVAWGLR